MKYKYDLREEIVFYWDRETTEEFYSWGHNSRYANVFWSEIMYNLDYYIQRIIVMLDIFDSNEQFWKE